MTPRYPWMAVEAFAELLAQTAPSLIEQSHFFQLVRNREVPMPARQERTGAGMFWAWNPRMLTNTSGDKS